MINDGEVVFVFTDDGFFGALLELLLQAPLATCSVS